MNELQRLQKRLSEGNQENNLTRNLYLVMEKVGGYSALMELPMPALLEIMQCMEYFAKQEKKAARRKR